MGSLQVSKTFWLIKASKSTSVPRVQIRTPAPIVHGSIDEEYHGDIYSFRGGRLHPIRGGMGRGGGGRGIPIQQYVKEEEGTEATTIGHLDGNLGTIKRKMPEFKGNNKTEEYFERERKVEMIFECQNHFEEKKMKLVAFEFIGYGKFWWDLLNKNRR
jgi:hypothetical protein